MSKRFTRFLMLLAIVFLAGGCFTILKSDQKKVRFTSEPPGATVVVVSMKDYFRYRSQTPTTLPLDSGYQYLVMFEHPGYHTQTLPVVEGTDAGAVIFSTAANLIVLGVVGGGVGLFIDAASGAMARLPDGVHLTLTPMNRPPPPNSFTYDVALAQIDEIVAARKKAVGPLTYRNKASPGRKGRGIEEPSSATIDTTKYFDPFVAEAPPPKPMTSEDCEQARARARVSGGRLSGGRKRIPEACR